jgi:hypothetical protein
MQEDSLFYIKGRLTTNKGEALANQTVNLISKEGDGIFMAATTDAGGRFLFPVAGYTEQTQFIIQAQTIKDKSVKPTIKLDSFSLPHVQLPAYLKRPLSIATTKRMAYLRKYADTSFSSTGNGWLQQVRVDTKKKSADGDKTRKSSSVLTSEQLMQLGMGNIGIGLLRMPGVQLIEGIVTFYGPSDMNGRTARSEPMVLMDGNQLSLSGSAGGTSSSPLIQFLNSLNPREIDYIEVFKGPEASIYGLRGGNGVISIKTSSKIHQDFTSGEGNVFRFSGRGYAEPAVFPQPDHSQKEGDNVSSPDLRSTLYWNENKLVDKYGRSSFQFFTNDVPGTYQVVISGITTRGELIYKTLRFTNK